MVWNDGNWVLLGAALNFSWHHFGTLPQSATKLARQQKSDCGEIGHWRATLRARRIWHTDLPVLNKVCPDQGGGLWKKKPERTIAAAAAALSFFLIGLAEITVLRPSSKQGSGNAPNE